MARAKQPPARKAPAKPSTAKRAGAKAPAPSVSKGGAVSETDAKAQLDGFFDKYTPEMAALGRASFKYMSKRLPGAVSLVYDNYNALAIGFGIEGRVKATPISIALYPRWANLFFLQALGLPDPHGLLDGSTAGIRRYKFTSVDQLKDERIDQIITAAVMSSGWMLDPKAKNRLVIQSISAKQRPRRP